MQYLQNQGKEGGSIVDEYVEKLALQWGLEYDEVMDAINRMQGAFNNAIETAREAIEKLRDLINKALSLEPRKRYELIKKLGDNIYPMFFQRSGVYHCRNNC